MFSRLEQQADEKRYDTRPLWEKLEADIAEFNKSHSTLKLEKASLKLVKLSARSAIFRVSKAFSMTVFCKFTRTYAILMCVSMTLESTHNQQNSST